MEELAKNEGLESEGVNQKSTVLIAQVSWCAHAWNATPQASSATGRRRSLRHLSRGGSVQVHVTDSHGREHAVEVTARRE